MAPRRPRDIGTHTESAVVRYLRTAGFPHAERRSLRGTLDAGDITGCIGTAWSVKGGMMACGASDALVERWLDQLDLQRRNAHAQVGVLVLQRRGIGENNASRWWAVMRGVDYEDLCKTGVDADWARFGSADPMWMHLATACRPARLRRVRHRTRPGRTRHRRSVSVITYYGTLRQSEADREDTIRTLICPACRAPRRTRCTRDGRTQGVSCTGRYDRAAERGLVPKMAGVP